MNINYSEFTSTGLVRKNNQDSLLCVQCGNYGLFVVADGMGGHFGGEIASGRLVEALNNWWAEFIAAPIGFEKCADVLKAIITEVNDSIYNEFSKVGKICGTTVALLLLYGDKYLLINVGDSRIYSLRRFKIAQESVDHVFSVEAKIAGKLTDEEINNHRNKNKLTSAIGCKEKFKMNVKTAPLAECSFFMCTDGVYKYCGEKDICKFLFAQNSKRLEQTVQRIIEGNGANDNFSYIKIKCCNRTISHMTYLIYAAAVFALMICTAAVIASIDLKKSSEKPPLNDAETTAVTTMKYFIEETSTSIQTTANKQEDIKTEITTQYTTTAAPAFKDSFVCETITDNQTEINETEKMQETFDNAREGSEDLVSNYNEDNRNTEQELQSAETDIGQDYNITNISESVVISSESTAITEETSVTSSLFEETTSESSISSNISEENND